MLIFNIKLYILSLNVFIFLIDSIMFNLLLVQNKLEISFRLNQIKVNFTWRERKKLLISGLQ